MNCSPAVASAALKRLEQQLETRLFVRSTRSLRLTAEGEQFLEIGAALGNEFGIGHGGLQAKTTGCGRRATGDGLQATGCGAACDGRRVTVP